MADEKKPKIDLKARLGKGAAGQATPPPPQAGGGGPAPVPVPSSNVAGTAVGQTTGNFGPGVVPVPTPTQPRVAQGLPVPPGIPVGPPPAFKSGPGAFNLDPSNPLAAAVAASPRAKSIPPPQPQRIEMDELTIIEARKGARTQGLIAGIIVGVVLGAIGYIAGGAQETNKGRAQSTAHAKSLATDVTKSRDQLKAISDKVEAGRNTLGRDHKFPDTLAKDLGGLNVDFDGSKLAGVRFSGFSTDTTTGLIEYITAVQALNNRKDALINLLNRLQKPINDQIKAAADNKAAPVTFVVLVQQDSQKNAYAILEPVQKPFEVGAMPSPEVGVFNPFAKANQNQPKFVTLDKGGVAYVDPRSVAAAFPSETTGQIGQLVAQLSGVINDIQGEKPAGGQDIVQDSKPGLLERADKLVTGLNKVN